MNGNSPRNNTPFWRRVLTSPLQFVFWILHFFLPSSFRTTRISIPVPSPQLAGLKLIHITDIHFNGDLYPRLISDQLLNKILRFIDEEAPDVLLFTGDFVHRDPSPITGLCERLSCLNILRDKRLNDQPRVYGVLGNHDYLKPHSRELVLKSLEDIGIKILQNEATLFVPKEGEDGLALIGCGDIWSADFHPKKALADLKNIKGRIGGRIVLSHNPDSATSFLQEDIDLILCGHTHGGQVCDPIWERPVLEYLKKVPALLQRLLPSGYIRAVRRWEWAKGLVIFDSSHRLKALFTGSGLASHLSLRLFCPPEVAVITLTH